MNSFNPQTFKKLLIVFGLSILIIFIFLMLRTFAPPPKEIELKSFHNPKKTSIIKIKEDSSKSFQTDKDSSKVKDTDSKFILLPTP